MPKKHEYLPMSLVTFPKTEEVFLLYSKGFENGPGIHRNGQGSPWMIDPQTQSRKVTDPHEQRRGTWLINEDARIMVKSQMPNWIATVADRKAKSLMDPKDADQRLQYYEEFVASLDKTPDYHSAFIDSYPGRTIVGMQGCGNLSMNEWYVAYICSEFTGNKSTFIALPEDRLDRVPPRVYTCLVKYKDLRVHIEPLVFNFLTNRITAIGGKDVTDQIEFAVYGTQVLRNGELVHFSNIVEQIADVRHLFKLPNLNPTSETTSDPQHRPRRFFGEKQYDDVWLGEAELLKNLALRRAALAEPVLINRQFDHMGADPDFVREVLTQQGYHEDTQGNRMLRYSDGIWRFREETDELIEVKLHRNVYAYSLIGLDNDGNLLALAVGGLAGRRGQTLEAATQNIKSYGATNALLIDQGDDVFQYAVSENNEYKARVKLLRPQLRSVFVWATSANKANSADAKSRAAD